MSDTKREPKPGECYGDWQCHTAASPIELAERCIFKWYAVKIAKRAAKTKLAKAGEIGTHCHNEMEAVRKGQASVSELSKLSRVAFDAVPPSVWQAEKHIDHQDVGLPWKLYGKRDLVARTPYRVLHRIWDYKYSSNVERYMPGDASAGDNIDRDYPEPRRPDDWEPPESLAHDTQMVLYSWAHVLETGVIPEVGHIQTNIDTGHRRRVWTRIPPVELVRQWLRIRDIVLRMHKASQQEPHEIETCGYPGRGPACWDYNRRCEAYDFCLETERDRRRSSTWEV